MRNLTGFRAAVALPALFLLASAREAKAQFVVSDPVTEGNTLAMHVEQVLQYAQEVQTALNTYNHLQLMIREVQQLATHPSTNTAADLSMFSSVLQHARKHGQVRRGVGARMRGQLLNFPDHELKMVIGIQRRLDFLGILQHLLYVHGQGVSLRHRITHHKLRLRFSRRREQKQGGQRNGCTETSEITHKQWPPPSRRLVC